MKIYEKRYDAVGCSPFVIALIIGAPILFINMTAGAWGKANDVLDKHHEEKMEENPSEYVKENILDIQFELEKGFISDKKIQL